MSSYVHTLCDYLNGANCVVDMVMVYVGTIREKNVAFAMGNLGLYESCSACFNEDSVKCDAIRGAAEGMHWSIAGRLFDSLVDYGHDVCTLVDVCTVDNVGLNRVLCDVLRRKIVLVQYDNYGIVEKIGEKGLYQVASVLISQNCRNDSMKNMMMRKALAGGWDKLVALLFENLSGVCDRWGDDWIEIAYGLTNDDRMILMVFDGMALVGVNRKMWGDMRKMYGFCVCGNVVWCMEIMRSCVSSGGIDVGLVGHGYGYGYGH